MVQSYVGSLAAVERSVELDRQLVERTRELEASHARVREMHDGMGSTLMSSLVLVEQAWLDSAAVAQVLRESIDDLKLTIDSLEPIGNDLLTLLATLRYRPGARLDRTGVKLERNVRDPPPLPCPDATASLQVLRIPHRSKPGPASAK